MEAGKRRLKGDFKRQATRGEVLSLRPTQRVSGRPVFEEPGAQKKLGWHGRRSGRVMRYTQSESMETICLVEASSLSVKRTLKELDIPRTTFYCWYRRYREEGYDGLANRPSNAHRFWNKIPESEKQEVIDAALKKPELTPRELAWEITDRHGSFISESSIYCILKDYDLVTSPAYIVLSASDEFRHKTKQVHELWQMDFTYFKILGWGGYYLSTVLDDFSRYIIAWILTGTMSADDVKRTMDLAVEKTGIEGVTG